VHEYSSEVQLYLETNINLQMDETLSMTYINKAKYTNRTMKSKKLKYTFKPDTSELAQKAACATLV